MKLPFILLILITVPLSASIEKSPIHPFLKPIELVNNSGLAPIQAIYVINLDRRPEKWAYIQRIFNQFGLYPSRLSAIEGSRLTHEEKQKLCGPYPVRLLPGQYGCILSHLSCLYDAKSRNLDLIWICEDDVCFLSNPCILSKYLTLLNSLDPNWDVLYTDLDTRNPRGQIVLSLGSDFRPGIVPIPLNQIIKRTNISAQFVKLGQRFGNYSYLVSQKGIKKILNHFATHYLWAVYDAEIHYVHNIREYALRKELVSINWQIQISDTQN